MKTLLTSIVMLLLSIKLLIAQTITPSCYSNTNGWRIEKIESTSSATYVYMSFYSYKAGYKFFINEGMYIEDYDSYNSAKYKIVDFVNNDLGREYTLQPYTRYDFTLKFEKIPTYWKNINIKEPGNVKGYTPWYWNYITLNSTDQLKKETFFKDYVFSFLMQFTHPLNTYRSSRYTIDYNSIRVTIYYQSYVTDLKIEFDGKWISNISVVYDNDFISPFSSLTLLKNYIMSQQDQSKYTSEFERELGKAFSQMTGKELGCLALTILNNID